MAVSVFMGVVAIAIVVWVANKAAQKTITFPEIAVVPPCSVLPDLAQATGMSRAEVASKLGTSLLVLDQLVVGAMPVTENLAQNLETLFGTPKATWLEWQAAWDKYNSTGEVTEVGSGDEAV